MRLVTLHQALSARLRVATFGGWLAALSALALLPSEALAQQGHADEAQESAVARVVFFFSPQCGHCEFVINERLPAMFTANGPPAGVFYDEHLADGDVAFLEMTNGTLQILFVNITVPAGRALFEADTERLRVPAQRLGVPRADIGEVYFIGSQEIPDELPAQITAALARGDRAWPPIPGLAEAIAAVPGMAEGNRVIRAASEAAAALPATRDRSVLELVRRDPYGNALAILFLVGMLVSLGCVPWLVRQGKLKGAPSWVVPTLTVLGIAVSAYLASVELSGRDAFCGPIGDCNTVQQSKYASIFGVPVGVLGVLAYLALLACWAVSRFGKARLAAWGTLFTAATAFCGTLFSIYLTFLEPFVIGATCAWCLASALLITSLFWSTAAPGWAAQRTLFAR